MKKKDFPFKMWRLYVGLVIPKKCQMKVSNWAQHNPKKWDKAYESGKIKSLVREICKK